MFSTHLHSTHASKYARLAQLGFVGLGVASIGVMVLLPRAADRTIKPIRLAEPPIPGRSAVDGTARVRWASADPGAVASRLGQIGNHPKLPDKPPPEEAGTAPPAVPTEESVRFLGPLHEPGRALALMKINDAQRILAVGDTLDRLKLVEVSDTYAMVDDGSGPRKVEKAARSGPSVTYVGSTPGGATGGAVQPGISGRSRGIVPGGNTPERMNVPESADQIDENANRARFEAGIKMNGLREPGGARPHRQEGRGQ